MSLRRPCGIVAVLSTIPMSPECSHPSCRGLGGLCGICSIPHHILAAAASSRAFPAEMLPGLRIDDGHSRCRKPSDSGAFLRQACSSYRVWVIAGLDSVRPKTMVTSRMSCGPRTPPCLPGQGEPAIMRVAAWRSRLVKRCGSRMLMTGGYAVEAVAGVPL